MTLSSMTREVDAVLFDFDGPICSVFAGYPAPAIAQELRDLILSERVALPESMLRSRNPLKLLQWTAASHPSLIGKVEKALRAAEERAVESAQPTKYGHESIIAVTRSGRRAGVVSNNSEPAVRAYLVIHGLTRYVNAVVGRPYARPDLMKPHPGPVLDAAHSIGIPPDRCVLVGDSPADVGAARQAGVPIIAYAKSDTHRQALENAGAELVIDTMRDVAETFAPDRVR
jgi:beta-phosphoglucomutase-like phosphatase (HAD superfamily)